MKRLLLVLATACATQSTADPALDALTPWPEDPHTLWKRCALETFEELAITCRVQAAANFGAAGNTKAAQEVCAEVPEGTWREECHFRAGEELGHAGLAVEGLKHCTQAGWFGRNCLTHTAWRLPRDPTVHPGLPAARIAATYAELDERVVQALDGAGDGIAGEGRDIMRARFGFNTYVGSGQTNPDPARLPDPLGPAMRTGFAIETARLLGPDASVEAILAVWSGVEPPLKASAVDDTQLNGRYGMPLIAPQEHGVPHIPVFGGGLRPIGETPDEDLTIAALEGMFWLESTTAETFLPWVDDPRKRVRRTAARLLSRTRPASLDLPAELERLSEHPDSAVQWYATQGLKLRAWEAPALRASAND